MDTKNLTINVLLVLLTATLVGGGVYIWKQNEVNSLTSKKQFDTEQIDSPDSTSNDNNTISESGNDDNSNENKQINIKQPESKSKVVVDLGNTTDKYGKAKIKTDEQMLKEAFATKYSRDVSDVDLEITDNDGTYAKGNVKFAGDVAGAWWLAAKDSGEWVIVADGNGVVECDDIASYDFPTSMVPECYDSTTSQMVTR